MSDSFYGDNFANKLGSTSSSAKHFAGGDYATDGFSLGLAAGDGEEIYYEIPGAPADSTQCSQIVAEYIVGSDNRLQSVGSGASNLSDMEYSDVSDCEENEESTSKRRKVEKPISSRQVATKSEAERKLAARINGLWEKTNFPNRVDISRDIKVEINPVSLALDASVKCLLCGAWFIIRKPGYTYLIHNYKRHVSKNHVNTAAPPLEPPHIIRNTGMKAALKKAANDASQLSVKSFFAPSTSSTPGRAHSRALNIEVLGDENIDGGERFILDASSGNFLCLSNYSGVESTQHDLGLADGSEAQHDIEMQLNAIEESDSETQGEGIQETNSSEHTVSATSSEIEPNGN